MFAQCPYWKNIDKGKKQRDHSGGRYDKEFIGGGYQSPDLPALPASDVFGQLCQDKVVPPSHHDNRKDADPVEDMYIKPIRRRIAAARG